MRSAKYCRIKEYWNKVSLEFKRVCFRFFFLQFTNEEKRRQKQPDIQLSWNKYFFYKNWRQANIYLRSSDYIPFMIGTYFRYQNKYNSYALGFEIRKKLQNLGKPESSTKPEILYKIEVHFCFPTYIDAENIFEPQIKRTTSPPTHSAK